MKIVRICRRQVLAISMVLSLGFTANAQRNIFSNSGKYMAVIITDTAGHAECVIQSTIDSWSQQFDDRRIENFQFSNDGKWMLYLNGSSLQINKIRGKEHYSIDGITSYRLQPETATGSWAACVNSKNELLLYNLDKKAKIWFRNASTFQFDPLGKGVAISQLDTINNIPVTRISWLSLQSQRTQEIWNSQLAGTGSKLKGGFFFDSAANQMVFNVKDSKGEMSIWYYQLSNKNARLILNDSIVGRLDSTMTLDPDTILGFNKAGNRVLFLEREHLLKKPDSSIIKESNDLDLWSYFDSVNMPYQKKFLSDRNYVFSYSIKDGSLVRLEEQDEVCPAFSGVLSVRDNIYTDFSAREGFGAGVSPKDEIIVFKWKGDIIYNLSSIPTSYLFSEYNWSEANRVSIYRESTIDGSRKLIKADMKRSAGGFPYCLFSPGGKYVVYFDEEIGQYMSFDTTTGQQINLSENIPTNLRVAGGYHDAGRGVIYQPRGIVGWVDNGTRLLVYDCYTDIWVLDPSGRDLPINITHSFCKNSDFTIEGTLSYSPYNILDVGDKQQILFYVRDNKEGEFGLISVDVAGKLMPEPKLMGRHEIRLMKSVKPGSFVIAEETNISPKRYYTTIDAGKAIFPLETINTKIKEIQSASKWTKDVVQWNTFSGMTALGALYKPMDFDPSKKYAVLFLYYEGAYLYTLKGGAPGGGGLNIDEAIARGYLVFVPDIRYIDTAKTCLEEAYDYVVSGAKYLSTLPYIQSSKMGLTGHSFGATETNYIITHTTMFAAAFSSAGLSDYVSNFGLEENQMFGMPRAESAGQAGLIGNVWSNRANYLDNSPVFSADKVETPLIIVANQNDFTVPSAQGVEFFKALRRLGKIVWMFRYPKEGHGYPKDADIREMQFFDYYLKGMPPPVWMTRGIPASMKGQTLGLEIDSTMQAPPPPLTIKGQ